jgi:ATPase subunit of ABC transporter with duplicated ATPase domains
MELVAAGLWGIRRFAEKGSLMDVAGSPIAIVGPNEAGKTTFLRTLQRLNDDAVGMTRPRFSRSFGLRRMTWLRLLTSR